MKKFFAYLLCLTVLLSCLSVAIGAENGETTATNVICENAFDELPAGMENNSAVTLTTNTALRITLPGKLGNSSTDTENAVDNIWGYKSYISLSDEMITEDCTVSFYWRRNAVDGFNHGFPLMFTDTIGKQGEGHNFAGIVSDHTANAQIFLFNNEDGVITNVATGVNMVPERGTTGDWIRVDGQFDFANGQVTWFFDGVNKGTVSTGDIEGFKGIKSYTVSSGNYKCSMWLDELVIRKGIIDPVEDDLVANLDRDAIEADETVMVYEPFDSINDASACNTNDVKFETVPMPSFAGQSTLKVTVPRGTDAFTATIPVSETDVTENATVSIKVKADYTVKTGPGLKIKLVNAEGGVLGGVVLGANCSLNFDDGTNVYTAKDASKADIIFKSGTWYEVSLLVNYTNKSLTVYIDDTRVGTVAFEGDISGFAGIQLAKYSDKGTKPGVFTFDNLLAVKGLYAPGSDEAIADTDALVTVDTEYKPEENNSGNNGGTTGGNQNGGTQGGNNNTDNNQNNDNNNGGADNNQATGTTAAGNTTTEKEGGCKSTVGGLALLGIIALGAAVASKKNR